MKEKKSIFESIKSTNKINTITAFKNQPKITPIKLLNRLSQKNKLNILKYKKNNLKQPFKKNKLNVGDFCELTITALGPKNIGIDEFSYDYLILIPNTKLGEKVKAQIIKINLKKAKYAIAKIYQFKKINELNKEKPLTPFLVSPEGKEQPILEKTTQQNFPLTKIQNKINVGDILTVKLNNILLQTETSCIGLVDYFLDSISHESKLKYQFILPLKNIATIGQELTIQITRIKLKYGFAKVLVPQSLIIIKKPISLTSFMLNSQKIDSSVNIKFKEIKAQHKLNFLSNSKQTQNTFIKDRHDLKLKVPLTKGSKITLTVPKILTKYAKHFVMLLFFSSLNLKKGLNIKTQEELKIEGFQKENPYVLFLPTLLGAKSGDQIRIKLKKIGTTFVIGKIVAISPNSSLKKLTLARKNLNEMIKNGMHYGEKIIKCHAKMRCFVWNTKTSVSFSPKPTQQFLTSVLCAARKGELKNETPSLQREGVVSHEKQNSGSHIIFSTPTLNYTNNQKNYLKKITSQEEKLKLDIPSSLTTKINGSSFPLQIQKETLQPLSKHPNKPIINKGRHLINLFKTRRCLNIGLNQLTKYAVKGKTFLFVGTKKPAAGLIARAALFTKTSFFVNTRWLGGMLTNWKTIIKSISKIRPILKEKQKVISNILQKRAKIQKRLIKKVLALRKKSKLLIKKGKQLIENVLPSLTKANLTLLPTTTQFLPFGEAKGQMPTDKLFLKRKELFIRGQYLLQKRQNILNKQLELKAATQNIKNCAAKLANKYQNLLNFLAITHKKFHNIRLLFLLNKALCAIKKRAKKQGKKQYILSFGKFKQLRSLISFSSSKMNIKNKNDQKKIPFRGSDLIFSKNFWLIPNPPQDILTASLLLIGGASIFPSKFSSPKPLGEGTEKATFSGSLLEFPQKPNSQQNFVGLNPRSEGEGTGILAAQDQAQTISFSSTSRVKKSKKIYSPLNFSPKGVLQTFLIKEKNTTSSPSIFSSRIENSKFGVILTKLLSKFNRFLPYIKDVINQQLQPNLDGVNNLQVIQKKLTELKINLKKLKINLINFVALNNNLNKEFSIIETKYISEQQIIRILRKKLKRHETEKKLLQFLPKLRYLPTPKNQISLAIQLLMRRFVDPKMKYPMDLIYDEKLRQKSKKVAAARKKKWQRLETYFGGISNMTKLNKTQISQNVAIIIGQQEEMNAVRECKKLGIKMFHIVDTNCNPSFADHLIPSNDDSRNAIKYLLTKIITRIRLAQKIRLRIKQK